MSSSNMIWLNLHAYSYELQPYMQARIVNPVNLFESERPAWVLPRIVPQNNICVGPETDQPEEMTIGAFTARVLRRE